MDSKILEPKKAAELALNVYFVNGNDPSDLKQFLADRIFSSRNVQKKLLTAEVGGRVFRAAKDAFGLCAMGGGAYEGDVFLVFRGTTEAKNKADFVTDARIGITRSKTGSPVHCGFNHTFNSMLPDIRDFLNKNNVAGRVHCIGHSLGGAVATLAADWAAKNRNQPVSLYTFGQPRVGLMSSAALCTSRIGKTQMHRVFHTTDPVPMVPVFPYVHSPFPGYGYRVLTDNAIHSGEAHRMANYAKNMAAKGVTTWSSLKQAPPVNTHEQAIKGWLRSNADANLACPKTFAWLENALIWLLSKAMSRALYGLQLAAIGIHSFVDMAAYVLAKGIELGKEIGEYGKLFFKKVMKIFGLKFTEGVTRLTRDFIRYLLQSVMRRVNEMAQRAVRGM